MNTEAAVQELPQTEAPAPARAPFWMETKYIVKEVLAKLPDAATLREVAREIEAVAAELDSGEYQRRQEVERVEGRKEVLAAFGSLKGIDTNFYRDDECRA